MPSTNGVIEGLQPIVLPDLSPERVSITVQRNGETVTLAGYVSGKRCPVPVTIEQAAAYQQWDDVKTSPGSTQAERDAVYLIYVRDSLKAVVPGLTDEEANIIAGDEDLRQEILVRLKWWVLTAPKETADPEATGETAPLNPSTTAPSSPASSPSTT